MITTPSNLSAAVVYAYALTPESFAAWRGWREREEEENHIQNIVGLESGWLGFVEGEKLPNIAFEPFASGRKQDGAGLCVLVINTGQGKSSGYKYIAKALVALFKIFGGHVRKAAK